MQKVQEVSTRDTRKNIKIYDLCSIFIAFAQHSGDVKKYEPWQVIFG